MSGRKLLISVTPEAKAADGIIELRQITQRIKSGGGTFEVSIPVGEIIIHIVPPSPGPCIPTLPLESFRWSFRDLPAGPLDHERALPPELTQNLQQLNLQMDYAEQSTLPETMNFVLHLANQRGVVLGSAPESAAEHQLQIKLLDRSGCERGLLYLDMRIQPQDEFLSASADANATQVCSSQFSHELKVSWQITGARSMPQVTIEITGPDGSVETLSTQTLEGARTFTLSYPGGGSANVKVLVKDGGSSSSAQASVQLGTCP